MNKYLISYDIKHRPEGWTREELVNANLGGCDAVVLVSIIRCNNDCEAHVGGKSFLVASRDGLHGGEIPNTELFQAMAVIAAKLSEDAVLPEWQKNVATIVHRSVINHLNRVRQH